MRVPHSRVLVAAVLVIATILPPSIAWFVVGAREVEREASRMESEPRLVAQATANRLADRLASQLESLRERESRRPWYHYQAFYHDPEGAAEGAAVARSPLARGSDDPLVLTHLQIENANRITFPTEEAGSASSKPRRRYAALVTEAIAWRATQPRTVTLLRPTGSTSKARTPKPVPDVDTRTEQQEAFAYAQNAQALQLATDIRRKQELQGSWPVLEPPRQRGLVTIEVGPFAWRTIEVDSVPALTGLRLVTTPEGRRVQAFVVDSTEVARSLAVAGVPARLVPDSALELRPSAKVTGTGWSVVMEPAANVADARARADSLRARFRRTFVGGMLATGLAGFGLVGLVWQADRLARERSRFAAAAAHELRTPLAGLRLYGEMMGESLGDPSQSLRYGRLVSAEAERLGRVVTNVLGFTRLERGTMPMRLEPGDLSETVREAAERQRAYLEAAGATLELHIEDRLPPVRFDRDAVHQILQNLLDNAERYTRQSPDRTITISLARADGNVALTISDHGPGVPARVRRPMFGSLRGRNVAPEAGLGIGLPLIRALARAHRGSVTYADTANGGAAVTVTLPIS